MVGSVQPRLSPSSDVHTRSTFHGEKCITDVDDRLINLGKDEDYMLPVHT